MDANQYMNESLDLLRRIACATEVLAEANKQLMSGALQISATQETVQVGEVAKTTTVSKVAKTTPAETPVEEANKIARESAEKAVSPNASAASAASTGASATAGEKPAKKISVDDIRTALKAYAAVQGNPAAMKLLEVYEVKSVTELMTGEDDEVQARAAKFIASCKV